MTDEPTQDGVAPDPGIADAPATPHLPPASNAPAQVDIDGLLSEYDRQSTDAATPDQATPDAPQADTGATLDDDALKRLDTLEGFALHVQERDAAQAAQQCFKDVVQIAEDQLGEHLASVPEGYVGRWFNSEMAVNAALADAWDKVYAADGNVTQADVERLQGELGRASKAMKAEVEQSAARQYDQQATGDRMAVSAAVKGASVAVPESDGPSFQEISNMPEDKKRAYAREVSRRYARN